jgi:chromosome condensin MukBEF ATPase and DNA-binding subunit MukB
MVVGCASNRPVVVEPILEHQREIAQLEERNNDLERRLDKYDDVVTASVDRLEAIGTRVQGMGSTIDEVIGLFGEYQRAVEQLIQNYRSIREENNPVQ